MRARAGAEWSIDARVSPSIRKRHKLLLSTSPT
jgi:hypothetical protein